MLGKTGFLMGGIVGGVMGILGGCLSAYHSKSLLPIPIAFYKNSKDEICFFNPKLYNIKNEIEKGNILL